MGVKYLLTCFLVDLLRNKSQPDAAADGAAAWVVSEREMRERLKKEKEARELKEKLEVSARRIYLFAELSIISTRISEVESLIFCVYSARRGGRNLSKRRKRRPNSRKRSSS